MNIIELLMLEHAALRVQLRIIKEKNQDSIYELHDFVRNCHARVEDEVVFPKLKELLGTKEEKQLLSVLSRLEADHRLLDMIGEQIKLSTTQGEEQTTRKRTMLYADTLESHNSSEEMLIFPMWHLDASEEKDIMRRSRDIMEQYGLDRYFRITGISQKYFDLIGDQKQEILTC